MSINVFPALYLYSIFEHIAKPNVYRLHKEK